MLSSMIQKLLEPSFTVTTADQLTPSGVTIDIIHQWPSFTQFAKTSSTILRKINLPINQLTILWLLIISVGLVFPTMLCPGPQLYLIHLIIKAFGPCKSPTIVAATTNEFLVIKPEELVQNSSMTSNRDNIQQLTGVNNSTCSICTRLKHSSAPLWHRISWCVFENCTAHQIEKWLYSGALSSQSPLQKRGCAG